MQVYENLIAHGYQLPESLTPAGLYVPVNRVGNLVFISGQGSIFKGENLTGRVGVDITLEQGQEAAKVCMLNTLGTLHTFLGDLNRVKKAVKIIGIWLRATIPLHSRPRSSTVLPKSCWMLSVKTVAMQDQRSGPMRCRWGSQ